MRKEFRDCSFCMYNKVCKVKRDYKDLIKNVENMNFNSVESGGFKLLIECNHFVLDKFKEAVKTKGGYKNGSC